MIQTLAVSGFRSLRDVRLRLGALDVVTGANGAGKSSLYRALRLIAEIAQGRVIAALAEQGGFRSVLWAGPTRSRKDPVSLKLGFADEHFGYAIDLGLPIPPPPPPLPLDQNSSLEPIPPSYDFRLTHFSKSPENSNRTEDPLHLLKGTSPAPPNNVHHHHQVCFFSSDLFCICFLSLFVPFVCPFSFGCSYFCNTFSRICVSFVQFCFCSGVRKHNSRKGPSEFLPAGFKDVSFSETISSSW